MTIRKGVLALKLSLFAVMAASLSGCIIYTDHGDGYHHKTPADEKPADTASF